MAILTNEEKLEIIEDVAAQLGDADIRRDYSGRGMFGRKCVGIVCDDAHEAIEEAAAHGLRGARIDSMGRQSIVYWETVTAEEVQS